MLLLLPAIRFQEFCETNLGYPMWPAEMLLGVSRWGKLRGAEARWVGQVGKSRIHQLLAILTSWPFGVAAHAFGKLEDNSGLASGQFQVPEPKNWHLIWCVFEVDVSNYVWSYWRWHTCLLNACFAFAECTSAWLVMVRHGERSLSLEREK